MNKKVECIKRLFKKQSCYHTMCEWLIELKLLTKQEANTFTREQERAEFMLLILEKAEKEEKFMLLDFEWTILPLETIKIMITTEREEKVFSFGH